MSTENNMSSSSVNTPGVPVPLVFMRESDIFGKRKPTRGEWINHIDLYLAISERIDASHIKGLQRIRSMWRIYVETPEDKVTLVSEGVPLRGRIIPVLNTSPDRLDSERITRIRVKNIPLSVDDNEIIISVFTLKGLDVISHFRERLRVRGKLTNCETGDRIVTVTTLSLKEPLPEFMSFNKFSGRVLHFGQKKHESRPKKCTKCLKDGHLFAECLEEWVCRKCNHSGHKMLDCPFSDPSESESEEDETSSNSADESSSTVQETEKPTLHTERPECPTVSPTKSPMLSNADTGNSSMKSTGAGRGSLLSCKEIQQSMDKYLHMTPNQGRPRNVTERSPPTPVDVLHDKQPLQGSKKKKNNAKS